MSTSTKHKSAQIGIRLTPEERQAIRIMAKLEALDISGYLRQLVRTDAKRRQLPDLGTLQTGREKHERTPQQP